MGFVYLKKFPRSPGRSVQVLLWGIASYPLDVISGLPTKVPALGQASGQGTQM